MFTYKWNLSDLKNVKQNGYTVFSCFAGGGGSSQGYKMAGYDVIGCNEIDPRQMDIYTHNLKPKYSYLEDIRTFRMRDDLPIELFNLDILDASFPCSLFSSANLKADDKKGKQVKFREGQVYQTLDDLAFETIHLVDKIKPKICVFENVKGLLQEKNKWYVEQIYSQFESIGYSITHKLINCADLGVPQKRERVFFIAVRKDLNFETIDLFGCEPKINLEFNERHITFGEIEKDNKGRRLTDHELNLINEFKDGDLSLGDIRIRVDNKSTGFGTQLVCQNITPQTIVSSCVSAIIDPIRKVHISDFELLQIGSWSQDYEFKTQKVKYVLGMSVPPLAMYKISKRIQECILDKF